MSRFIPFPRVSLIVSLLACHASAYAVASHQGSNPFDNDTLPDLGVVADDSDITTGKQLATMAKDFGEQSMVDSDLGVGERARLFAITHLRDALVGRVTSQAQALLSTLGKADLNLLINDKGKFTGSSGSIFTPWLDNNRWLTWTQFGLSQQDDGLIGNAGIGQRWVAGDWLLGYNTFYDTRFDDRLGRAGVGAEAWGEYLRLSANYYAPLGGWRHATEALDRHPASGYDVTAQAWLPFYRHINTNLSVEQYFGDRVDLFDNGIGYHDPVAIKVGLNYTPVPLVTLTAWHKHGEAGTNQNNLGLKLNYRFGIPLAKQLSADEVAAASSLRGSRYDRVERNALPVVTLRQRKTLTAFLATPPWDLHPGETVALKMQVQSTYGIRKISWQGDTSALSLTPPINNIAADGWTIIIPPWDDSPEAENSWQLSAVVEDNRGQTVTTNTITLAISEPFTAIPQQHDRYRLLPAK